MRRKDEAKGREYTDGERARGNTGAEGLIRGDYRHQSFLSRGFQRMPRSLGSLRIGGDVLEDPRVRSINGFVRKKFAQQCALSNIP